MSARPITLITAVTLLGVIGASFAFAGVLLLVLAGAGLGLLAPAGALVGLLGAVAVLAAVVTAVAAVGLWRGRSWGWAASLAVGLVALAGSLIALSSGGLQAPLLAGLALTVTAVVLVLARPTRTAAGVARS